MTTPARASSNASSSATASPYGVGLRDPTIATRGPSGGGHRPRVRRSGGDILEAEAQRFQDVALLDRFRGIEVGRGAGDAPGAVKATRRQTSLSAPALQRAPGRRGEPGEGPQTRRLELRVETALSLELPAPGEDHPPAHGFR